MSENTSCLENSAQKCFLGDVEVDQGFEELGENLSGCGNKYLWEDKLGHYQTTQMKTVGTYGENGQHLCF